MDNQKIVNLRFFSEREYSMGLGGFQSTNHSPHEFLASYATGPYQDGCDGNWYSSLESLADDLVGALFKQGHFKAAVLPADLTKTQINIYQSSDANLKGKPKLSLSRTDLEAEVKVTGASSDSDYILILAKGVLASFSKSEYSPESRGVLMQ